MDRRRFCLVLFAAMSAATVPPARAQGKVHRIGYLMLRQGPADVDEAFFAAMRELGYAAGRNLHVEYRYAGNDLARIRSLADELVRLDVDLIVTATTAGTRAAMGATRTIPIVTAATADPVAAGLVQSLGRPGGNVTGLSLQTTDMARKRLQQMQEIVPGARRIAVLAQRVADPTLGTTALFVGETQAAATELGIELVVAEVGDAAEIDAAFARFRREDAHALVVQVGPLTLDHAARITDAAARERLPAMYEVRGFVDRGGFVAYGPDLRESYRLAAGYVDRILKGARPGDLPVQQPGRMSLIVNLKAADAVGIAVPRSLLMRADDVVR